MQLKRVSRKTPSAYLFPARRCFGGGLYTMASSFMPSGSVEIDRVIGTPVIFAGRIDHGHAVRFEEGAERVLRRCGSQARSRANRAARAPRLSSINHYINKGLNTILSTKRNSLNSDRSNCAFGFFVWRKCHEQIQLPCAGGTVSLAQPQEQAAGQIPAVRNGGARNPVCNGGAPATGLARRLHRDRRGAARARGHSRALRESGVSAQETSDERDHRPRARERSLNSRSRPISSSPPAVASAAACTPWLRASCRRGR